MINQNLKILSSVFRQIGIEHGDCWAFFPDCDYSIFDFIPGKNPDGTGFEVVLDKIETGGKVSESDMTEEKFNDVFADMKTPNSKFDVRPVIIK